jgi:hypothetical protein
VIYPPNTRKVPTWKSAQPQNQPPRASLPPPQPFYQYAVVRRGKGSSVRKVADQRRGIPFSIIWDAGAGNAKATFGTVGTYVIPWLDHNGVLDILSAGDQIRRFNQLYKSHR